jgi:hypothetical protein
MQKSGESIASSTKIQSVGSYDRHLYIAEPPDCTVCHNAEYGDFLYNGVCGKCLYAHFKKHPQIEGTNIFEVQNSKVFATWYVKGAFEDVIHMIGDISIALLVCEVDSKDFQGDEDEHWKQQDGFFPEEGIVTLRQVSVKEDPAPRWEIRMMCDDCETKETFGPERYSLSPVVIDCSWDSTFTRMLYGEAAEWGIV